MNTSNIYNVNFKSLAYGHVPNKLKKNRFLNWVYALIVPFNYLAGAIRRFRREKNYQLLITPQKCYLEKMLNDRFDSGLRRIYIEDGKDFSPLFIFRRDELKPKYISTRSEDNPKYIYTRGESGIIKDDFVVYVPISIAFDMNEMAGLIKIYKLAGTKFKIQRF